MIRTSTAPDHLQSAAVTAADAVPPEADDSGWADELAGVFATELEEHLSHVPALATLLASPETQAVACAKLSRIFHTIKGSAAVVGRSDLSVIAKRLQDAFGNQAEQSGQRPLTAEFYATVQTAIDELCTTAGHTAPQLLHPLAVPHTDVRDLGAAATPEEPAELLQAFALDANEALDKAQGLLLALERGPHDASVLRELFRHFHTLKGAAAAVGLDEVAQHLHHGESLLDAAVEERVQCDPPRLVDFLLRLTDSVAGLINVARGVTDGPHVVLSDVEAEVVALLAPPAAATAAPPPPVEAEALSPGTLQAAGVDATSLQIDGDHLDALLEHIGQLLGATNRIDRRVATLSLLRDQLDAQRARLTAAIETFRERYEFRRAEGSETGARRGGAATAVATTGPAADIELDGYDEVGLLARNVVEHAAHSREITDRLASAIDALGDETAKLSQVTSALRHGITQLRSVPLDHVFRRLVRAVRDAARQEGKHVELQFDGGALELDKSLVDRLHAPLLHLVRNAVSHGIELPAARQARSKPATGTVRIAATLRDRTLSLSLADDGGGIDFDAIAARGRTLGLVPPGETWRREQLLPLIFQSGFSTHQAVTGLAGRGVGMDVVAADIAALNGSVTIDSHDGQGTTVQITLPITSSIDEVLLVQTGTQLFALPVGLVDQVIPVDVSDLLRSTPRTVTVRGEVLPALVLAPLVGEPAPLERAVAVALRAGGRTVALVVDHVQAQHEALVRPLGPMLEAHPLLAGAVVSGTGAVILVLHAGKLAELAAAPTEQREGLTTSDTRSTPPNQGHAVLFVDDSISVRKVATHFLEASGLEVHTAIDGLDAVDKLATGRFSIVVTDLEMPRMHGYELIAAIRRHALSQHLPVVVCSSRSGEKYRQRAFEMGAQGYLTKPFTQEQLLREIQRLTQPASEPPPLLQAIPSAAP